MAATLWQKLTLRFLSRTVTTGRVAVTFCDGSTHVFGPGPGDPVHLTIRDPGYLRRLCLNPELAIGEGYVDQAYDIAGDDLRGFLALCLQNLNQGQSWALQRLMRRVRRQLTHLTSWNSRAGARRHVAHHYDLSHALFRTFLDEDLHYSCAYFSDDGMTLEAAQQAKAHHIARKLCSQPGQSVLDIGCGWGSLAIILARDYGLQVTAITLSAEQLALAQRRVAEAGLGARIDLRLQDYRDVQGQFDRIVSVAMFEQVGTGNYDRYFGKIGALLREDGVALVHTIGRSTPPAHANPWITKYIFPGGYAPALSEMVASVERKDLIVTDVEIWRLHYAQTLVHWQERFDAHRDEIAKLYDDRFVRMWRFYLIATEMAFRFNRQSVFQVQLARKQDSVPLTRGYLYDSKG